LAAGEGDPRDTGDELGILRERILSSVRKLRHMDLTMLQVEIADRLMDGRRTATELVEQIFETRSGDPEFQARYAAIRREIKTLENRGYVSTTLFGRDRPYKLTPHGIALLTSILPEDQKPRILGRWDLAAFIATTLTGASLLLFRRQEGWPVFVLFALFFLLLGASLSSFARTLRKVF